jgi:hypothetical protein
LQWHLPQVDRVLHVKHGSQLDQMEAAFAALGKKLVITVVDESQTRAMLGRTKGRVRSLPALSATGRRKPAGSDGVHPGVLMRQARPVRSHAASGVAAGRHVTARKAAKKR